jgi:hypothetical protein
MSHFNIAVDEPHSHPPPGDGRNGLPAVAE